MCGGGQGSELQEIGQGAKQRGGTPITALLRTFLLSERGGEDIFESVKKMEERDKKRKKKKREGKETGRRAQGRVTQTLFIGALICKNGPG